MSRRYKDLRKALDAAIASAPDDCWMWPVLNPANRANLYGRIAADDGRIVKAHRHVWQLYHGPIPAGTAVCHRCDQPGCVNPRHLYLGDHASNMRDKALRERGHNLRVSNAQVAEALAMRAAGAKHSEIAARFGMSVTWSVRVCKHQRRQHVTPNAVTSD